MEKQIEQKFNDERTATGEKTRHTQAAKAIQNAANSLGENQ